MERKQSEKSGIRASMGRISYINVQPVYYGLGNGQQPEWLELIDGAPTVLNRMMAEGSIDISPVSSVAYARNREHWMLLPDLSISCFEEVMSVLLVSRYPLTELDGQKILLTADSATSVDLLKLIFAMKGIRPLFETGVIEKCSDLPADAAGALIIGDAALTGGWEGNFPHILDLGKLWFELTGLPFTFALWTVRKSFARKNPQAVSDVIRLLDISKRTGYANMDRVIENACMKTGLPRKTCARYYKVLDCSLTGAHIRGLEIFFGGLHREGILPERFPLEFFDPGEMSRSGERFRTGAPSEAALAG